MILAWLSDKMQHRFLFVVIPLLVTIAGFAILISVHNHRNVQYAALFLVAMGAYTAMPVIVCCKHVSEPNPSGRFLLISRLGFNMNLGGHHRRSVGSAWQVAFGNAGGIIAVFSFLKKDSPKYVKGYSICISFVCLSLISCVAYYILCMVENKKRDRAVADRSLTEYEKTELGDKSPDYRYLL
jgi:hypothetical protein